MSRQIWLVRHGQASWDQSNYDQLSALGYDQCAALGESLTATGRVPDRVVIGGLRRHRQSWDSMAETMGSNVAVTVDCGWDEYDHDDVLARRYPELSDHSAMLEFANKQPDAAATFQRLHDDAAGRWAGAGSCDDYRESFPEFSSRVMAALSRLSEARTAKTTLVITSGGPISAVVSQLSVGGNDLWAEALSRTLNASITTVVVNKSTLKLLSYNEHSHLPVRVVTSV